MGKIVILDENTSNKIAAGEVIEKPASVVKELVENSIDAGAGHISIEIKNGGISFIKVTDNGSGIDEDDVEIAFERHATSKIRSADDLDSIRTMGFRGEALASIAAVSTVELTTRVLRKEHGTYIKVQGGNIKEVNKTGCPTGTTFVIRDLFYNTPARFKFLKKDATEAGYVSEIISRIALGNPQISLRLTSNNVSVLHTPGNNDLLSVIYSVYGKETARDVLKIDYESSKFKITGYAGKPEIARSNRNQQTVFINGRYVKSKVITSAVDEAYNTYLMKNKFAFIVLNIELNPMLVDVNVHPTKMEVRFAEEQEIFRNVYHAVANALTSKPLVKDIVMEERKTEGYRFERSNYPDKKSFVQQDLKIEHCNFNHENRNESTPETTEKPVLPKEPEVQGNPWPYGTDDFIVDNTESVPALRDTKPFQREVIQREAIQREAVEKEATGKETAGKEKVIRDTVVRETVTSDITDKTVTENGNPLIFRETGQEPDESEKEEHIPQKAQNSLKDARIIGQVFSTYILLQLEGNMLMIDQHAAHERILYEKLKKRYQRNDQMSQVLLAPVAVELTIQELRLLEEEKEFFIKLGYIYEEFGNNSIILRAIPFVEDISSPVKETFLEVLDFLMKKGKFDYRLVADETLHTIACKAAVKANKRLDDMEIRNILMEMGDIENPYTCPHGRPTVIRFSKYELEKMFKRIV